MGTLCYTIWSWLYTFPQKLIRFHILMFMFHGSVGLSGCWEGMRSYANRVEKKNAYPCSLHWLVQYGANGKCPSFFCMDFFVLFVNSSFTLMSIFRSIVQSLLCESNNMWQVRQCSCLNHNKRCRKCWVCCVCVLSWSAFSCMAAKRENLQTKLSWKRYYNHTLMYIYQKLKTFHTTMTVTLTVTQMTLLTQTAHSELSIKLSTYCTCNAQVGRGSHWVMTNSGTPHH